MLPVEMPQLRTQTLSSGANGLIFARQPECRTVYSLKVDKITHVALFRFAVCTFPTFPSEHWKHMIPNLEIFNPFTNTLHNSGYQDNQIHPWNHSNSAEIAKPEETQIRSTKPETGEANHGRRNSIVETPLPSSTSKASTATTKTLEKETCSRRCFLPLPLPTPGRRREGATLQLLPEE
nr:hypothetical protein Iba_chr12bCG22290 [Ipomoea batatas]